MLVKKSKGNMFFSHYQIFFQHQISYSLPTLKMKSVATFTTWCILAQATTALSFAPLPATRSSPSRPATLSGKTTTPPILSDEEGIKYIFDLNNTDDTTDIRAKMLHNALVEHLNEPSREQHEMINDAMVEYRAIVSNSGENITDSVIDSTVQKMGEKLNIEKPTKGQFVDLNAMRSIMRHKFQKGVRHAKYVRKMMRNALSEIINPANGETTAMITDMIELLLESFVEKDSGAYRAGKVASGLIRDTSEGRSSLQRANNAAITAVPTKEKSPQQKLLLKTLDVFTQEQVTKGIGAVQKVTAASQASARASDRAAAE